MTRSLYQEAGGDPRLVEQGAALKAAAARLLAALAVEEEEHGFPFSFEARQALRDLKALVGQAAPHPEPQSLESLAVPDLTDEERDGFLSAVFDDGPASPLDRLAAWCDESESRYMLVGPCRGNEDWMVRVWDYDVSSVSMGLGAGSTLAEAVAACLDEDQYTPPLRSLIDPASLRRETGT